MPDVFISYNREEREKARLVASALEAEGFSVWWDVALRAGETYDEVTEQNLRTAGAVVVLWSKRSAGSKWVRAEATVGERSSTLVPALIEDCERPIRFELVQTADLRHWQGDRTDPHWRAFMQDIEAAVARRASTAGAAAAPASASQDHSIEAAFWNSIKDGKEAAEFAAYLKRYPHGHFVDLAKNRLAALSPSPAAARPAAAQAGPPRQSATRPAAATRKEKSGGGLMIAGFAAALAGLLAVVFTLNRGKDEVVAAAPSPAVAQTETIETAPAPVETGGPVATAAEEMAGESDEIAALDEAGADAASDGAAPDSVIAETALLAEAAAPEETMSGLEETAAAASEPAPEPEAEAKPIAPASAPSEAVVSPSEAVSETPRKKVRTPRANKTFRDCPDCPLMMSLPAGDFLMGSPADETGRNAYEGPQHEVAIKRFAIGVYEVTSAEWNACVADGGCRRVRADDTGKLPALGVSWLDAKGYAEWLTRKTGRKYRLPSEAEWEYAARAGATTAYWWGEKFDAAKVPARQASAVGSYAPNGFGLYDVLGNAREWVADCYVNNYREAPTDGSAVRDGDCGKRVIRGGSWANSAVDIRTANRSRIDAGTGASYMGVRVAAEVDAR